MGEERNRTRRRGWTAAGASLLTAVALAAPFAGPGPAGAAEQAPAAAVADRSAPLPIRATASGFTAPESASAGVAVFSASTTAEGSGWIVLARPRPGVRPEQVRAAVTTGENLDGTVENLGGLVVHPGLPGTFSQVLEPGPYYWFDAFAIGRPNAQVRTLTVRPGRAMTEPTPTATVGSVVGPRYTVSGTVRAGQPVRFVNRLPFANEMLFVRLEDGVTEADLAAYYKVMDSDPPPAENPFAATSLGSLPLSTGRDSVVTVPTRPGRYVIMTYIRDPADDVRLVQKGMFAIVTVA